MMRIGFCADLRRTSTGVKALIVVPQGQNANVVQRIIIEDVTSADVDGIDPTDQLRQSVCIFIAPVLVLCDYRGMESVSGCLGHVANALSSLCNAYGQNGTVKKYLTGLLFIIAVYHMQELMNDSRLSAQPVYMVVLGKHRDREWE